jgi:hypothetical protein
MKTVSSRPWRRKQIVAMATVCALLGTSITALASESHCRFQDDTKMAPAAFALETPHFTSALGFTLMNT